MQQIIETSKLNDTLVNAKRVEHLEKNVYKVHGDNGYEIFEVIEFNADTKVLKVRHNHTVHELAFKRPVDMILDELGIKAAAGNANKDIKAPMPGKVLDVMVKVGDTVSKGSPVLILEAMKMENVLKAESDGLVKKVMAVKDSNVEKNEVLVELDL